MEFIKLAFPNSKVKPTIDFVYQRENLWGSFFNSVECMEAALLKTLLGSISKQTLQRIHKSSLVFLGIKLTFQKISYRLLVHHYILKVLFI
ncbi:hypothetical protein PROCOU_07758 [Listeria rocourtiae FSL F6-920]|nr:hypothetical protein PROCOU_07758 [Listeria rocourtiae FSL F6-920]